MAGDNPNSPVRESPMPKIAFAGAFASRLAEPVRAYLTIPCEIVTGDETSIVAALGDVDVLVTLAFTREMSRAAGMLKLIQVPGAGLDRIERATIPAGVRLANAYGHETGIAEYAIGAMLTLSRDFNRLDARLRQGHWESQWAVGAPAPALWPELAGKTLGILGYGHIGEALARRARALDMEVIAVRRDASGPKPDAVSFIGGPERLNDVLKRADFLVITLALTAQTRGLLGEEEFRLMKRSAFLINVARAEIVDEAALYRALAERTIAGAALDVWYRYPTDSGPRLPATAPFHELANVLMTPHVSGWTEGMLAARSKLIAENIRRVADGALPLNLVSA